MNLDRTVQLQTTGAVKLFAQRITGSPGDPNASNEHAEIVIGNGPGGHPRVRVIVWPPAGPVQRLEILPLEIP